jgi:hypothetical protein
VSEVKGAAMLKGTAQGMRWYLGTVVLQHVLWSGFGVTVPGLAQASGTLRTALLGTLAVFVAWNVHAELERRRERRLERAREKTDRALAREEALARTVSIRDGEMTGPGVRAILAVQEMMAANMVSMAALRAKLPPAGLGHPSPYPRLRKSACDNCDLPMDTVWCPPGALYLCQPCAGHFSASGSR